MAPLEEGSSRTDKTLPLTSDALKPIFGTRRREKPILFFPCVDFTAETSQALLGHQSFLSSENPRPILIV